MPTSDQDDCCKILCPMLAPEKTHSVRIHALEINTRTHTPRTLCMKFAPKNPEYGVKIPFKNL